MEIYLVLLQGNQPDWKVEALKHLEKDVNLFANRYHIRGMEVDDVKQEMRHQLWRKFDKYDPLKASLRTWSWRVMRNRCTDLDRQARDMLDQDARYFPEDGEDLREKGNHIFALIDSDQVPKDLLELYL